MGLLRITQEALTNVAKHAEATKVDIDLVFGEDGVDLQITDDGRGFDSTAIPPGHFGIGNMMERSEKIGATFDLESEPGGGTRITVTWPEQTEEYS